MCISNVRRTRTSRLNERGVVTLFGHHAVVGEDQPPQSAAMRQNGNQATVKQNPAATFLASRLQSGCILCGSSPVHAGHRSTRRSLFYRGFAWGERL